jgi:hypothetical protein
LYNFGGSSLHIVSFKILTQEICPRDFPKSRSFFVQEIVLSVYGASIWDTKSYSCINSIHNRAIRYFLGTSKYTPNAAVYSETGWNPIIIEQWKAVGNHWHRTLCLRESRMNKKIFNWAFNKKGKKCKNWCYIVENTLLS